MPQNRYGEKKPKIYLESISSSICEDDYEHGEMDDTGCGIYPPMQIGKTFDNMNDMFEYLEKSWGLSDNPSHYECEKNKCYFDKLVADHSKHQNGGWFEPTEEELEKWKRGEQKLYNESSIIKYHRMLED